MLYGGARMSRKAAYPPTVSTCTPGHTHSLQQTEEEERYRAAKLSSKRVQYSTNSKYLHVVNFTKTTKISKRMKKDFFKETA